MANDNNAPIVVGTIHDNFIKSITANKDINQAERIGKLYYNSIFDLVTCARIIDGESYTVDRDFQVGDLVYSNKHKTISRIVANQSEVHGNVTNSLKWVQARTDEFTLVAKAENVEKGVFI